MRRSALFLILACALPVSTMAVTPSSTAPLPAPLPAADIGARIDVLAGRAARLPADHRAELVRALRTLGPGAVGAMLQRLQTESPAMLTLRTRSAAAHDAFVAALLDALGSERPPAAESTFARFFTDSSSSPFVAKMAAEGLGRLCTDSSRSLLAAHLVQGDVRELAAANGLGLCRVEPSAQALIARLGEKPSSQVTREVAYALGMMGSSWAWEALGPSAQARGQQIRSEAAEALLAAYPETQGLARYAVITAILMIDDRAVTDRPIAKLAPDDELRARWDHLHRD